MRKFGGIGTGQGVASDHAANQIHVLFAGLGIATHVAGKRIAIESIVNTFDGFDYYQKCYEEMFGSVSERDEHLKIPLRGSD